MFLGALSFSIIVDEVVFSCMEFSPGLSGGILLLWSIKRILGFNIGTLLSIENNFNNNKFEAIEKV